jgi:hypothetical protein
MALQGNPILVPIGRVVPSCSTHSSRITVRAAVTALSQSENRKPLNQDIPSPTGYMRFVSIMKLSMSGSFCSI